MSAAGAEHCPALVPLLQKKKVHTCSETDVPLDMGTASGANPVADLGPKQGAMHGKHGRENMAEKRQALLACLQEW